MTAPLITLAGDTTRARRRDPESSHQAADVSSYRRRRVLLAVLQIVADDGPTTGSEINADYPAWRVVDPAGFPRCHPDSPRKRLQEAAAECLVDLIGHRASDYGTKEAIYRISPDGLALLKGMNR